MHGVRQAIEAAAAPRIYLPAYSPIVTAAKTVSTVVRESAVFAIDHRIAGSFKPNQPTMARYGPLARFNCESFDQLEHKIHICESFDQLELFHAENCMGLCAIS
jgi:hypothetical protein